MLTPSKKFVSLIIDKGVSAMFIIEIVTVTVKCRTAIKALFLCV